MPFLAPFFAVAVAMLATARAAPIPAAATTFLIVESEYTPISAGITVPFGTQTYVEKVALPNRYSVETPFTTLSFTDGQTIPSVIPAPPLTWTVAVDENGSTSIVAPHTTASIWTAA